jgi:hypothetical protein
MGIRLLIAGFQMINPCGHFVKFDRNLEEIRLKLQLSIYDEIILVSF